MQDYTEKKIGAWGFFINWWKNVSSLHYSILGLYVKHIYGTLAVVPFQTKFIIFGSLLGLTVIM